MGAWGTYKVKKVTEFRGENYTELIIDLLRGCNSKNAEYIELLKVLVIS